MRSKTPDCLLFTAEKNYQKNKFSVYCKSILSLSSQLTKRPAFYGKRGSPTRRSIKTKSNVLITKSGCCVDLRLLAIL